MKSTQNIDRAIGELRETAARIEADRRKNEEKLLEMKSTRDEFRLLACTGDSGARAKLDQIYNEQRKMELTIEDCTGAIAQVDRQISALEAERETAVQRERWAEFEKVGEVAKDQARDLSGILMGLARSLAEHGATLRRLTALAHESGHAGSNFKLAHFRRFLFAELHKALPFEFGKQSGVYREARYDAFLENLIDSAGNHGAESNNSAEQVAG